MESHTPNHRVQSICSSLQQQATPCIQHVQNQLTSIDLRAEITITHHKDVVTIYTEVVEHSSKY